MEVSNELSGTRREGRQAKEKRTTEGGGEVTRGDLPPYGMRARRTRGTLPLRCSHVLQVLNLEREEGNMILKKEELETIIAAAAQEMKEELPVEEKLVILQLHLACMSYNLYYQKEEARARLSGRDAPSS